MRLLFNLWIVFIASGLWHGAAWGFIIWGAYHGLFLILERLFLSKWLVKLGKAACIYTFLIVVVGWVFFRAVEFNHSIYFLQHMFKWYPGDDNWMPDFEYLEVFALAVLFSFFTLPAVGMKIQQKIFYGKISMKQHYIFAFSMLLLFIISAGRITTLTSNVFLYFRF